jgi:hypothetical protein
MAVDRSVTARFTKDIEHSTYIPSRGGIYSPTIGEAYNAAVNDDIILLWGIDFTEDIVNFPQIETC